MKTELEPYYARQGRELVDLLVDKKFVKDDLTREEARVLEDYIGFLFQSQAQSVKRTANLMRKYEKDTP